MAEAEAGSDPQSTYHIIPADMHRLCEVIYDIGAGYGLTRATSYSGSPLNLILPPYTLQSQSYLRRGGVRVHNILLYQ